MKKRLNYKEYINELEAAGYRCTYYGNSESNNGLAYFESENQVLRIEYQWEKVSERHYTAGAILSIDDMSHMLPCYPCR